MQEIPMATQAAGQNNNVGGASAINQPWGGSGMDMNSMGRILDPLGISGNGGMNKSAAEAFLDPAGIDSGSYGLNLFGKRPDPNAGANAAFPNLGAASMIPQAPGGAFQHIHNGAGVYNNMAATGAGGLAFNPSANAGGPKPSQGSPIGISPQMKHPVAPVNAPRNMGQPDIQNIMARYGNMTGGNK